jgi:tetratricopeptide (TPR) repeat protein
MKKERSLSGIHLFCLATAIVLVLCIAGQGISQGPSQEKAEQKQGPAPSLGVEEPRDAGTFFREAQRVAQNDPIGAIRLYQRGLILKPDAWPERKQLAALYEKQQQWSLAISEYEAVNKATGSAESFGDVVRAMDKAGFPRSAAATARKAFEKHPDRPLFLYLAGELFQKSGAGNEAVAALQEYTKLTPDEGKAFYLLGSIHEKEGRKVDALRAYLRARELMKNDKDAADAARRLQAGAVTVEGLIIFLPQGWSPDKGGLSNIRDGQRVTVSAATAGDPAVLALKAAREAMPEGMFTDPSLKSYEDFKKMREEMAKIDPGSAKSMESIPTPSFSTRDLPHVAGAKMVLLSTGETPHPDMQSAAAVAVPSGGKIYTMVWKAAGPVEDAEKALGILLKQTMWSK